MDADEIRRLLESITEDQQFRKAVLQTLLWNVEELKSLRSCVLALRSRVEQTELKARQESTP